MKPKTLTMRLCSLFVAIIMMCSPPIAAKATLKANAYILQSDIAGHEVTTDTTASSAAYSLEGEKVADRLYGPPTVSSCRSVRDKRK